MVAVSDKIAHILPEVDYDRRSDVLYVSLGSPIPDEGEDRPHGIVLRFSVENNYPSGVTVIGFRKNHWDEKLSELCEIIGTHLIIDRAGVREAIQLGLRKR